MSELSPQLKDYIEKLVNEQESLTAKYMGETKLKPSEICLVEQEHGTGRVFFPDLKSKYHDDKALVRANAKIADLESEVETLIPYFKAWNPIVTLCDELAAALKLFKTYESCSDSKKAESALEAYRKFKEGVA